MLRPDLEIRLCRPEEVETSWEIERACWAPFNWEADGSVGVDYFPALHVVAVDRATGELVATIDACPMRWDGNPTSLPQTGWTGVVLAAQEGFVEPPPYACALGASILPAARGGGLARLLLCGLRDAARDAGYRGLLAPVRPTARVQMPHLTIDEYANVRLVDGRHFDPWVRTHETVGGTIIGGCEQSAVFTGTHSDWERWVGTRLPYNGRVLAPHTAGWLDLSNGLGVLTEGSLWLHHDLRSGSSDPARSEPTPPADSHAVKAPQTPAYAGADEQRKLTFLA